LGLPKDLPLSLQIPFWIKLHLEGLAVDENCIQDLDCAGVAGVRGMKTWIILSRFKIMAYVARVTTGGTIASEERLKKGIVHTPERLSLWASFRSNEIWICAYNAHCHWEEGYADACENLDILP
jgi:hypothetical protein